MWISTGALSALDTIQGKLDGLIRPEKFGEMPSLSETGEEVMMEGVLTVQKCAKEKGVRVEN